MHQMLTVPATLNPEKVCCGIPTRVHPHLPGLILLTYGALSDPVLIDTVVPIGFWPLTVITLPLVCCLSLHPFVQFQTELRVACIKLLQHINLRQSLEF